MQEAVVTQSDMTYIRRRKETVEHWVALRLVFEVCIRETGYEEGGRMRDAWSNKMRQRHSVV